MGRTNRTCSGSETQLSLIHKHFTQSHPDEGQQRDIVGVEPTKENSRRSLSHFKGFLGSGRVATVTTAAIQASWRIPTFCVMSPLNQMPLMHLQMFEMFEEKYLKYSTSHVQIKRDAFASSRFFSDDICIAFFGNG